MNSGLLSFASVTVTSTWASSLSCGLPASAASMVSVYLSLVSRSRESATVTLPIRSKSVKIQKNLEVQLESKLFQKETTVSMI